MLGQRHFYVDVTASILARDGPVSGVVRVEQEICARLPDLLGAKMSFIWWDQERGGLFYHGRPGRNAPGGPLAGDPVTFAPGARYVSFGLECNTKDYRNMLSKVRCGDYELYSVLYDLTGALEPQLTIPGYGEYLRGFFADMMHGVTRYLAISEHTKRQLHLFADQELLHPPDCAVFPLGCNLPVRNEEQLAAHLRGKRYALFVSTVEARKNHYVLYRAFDRALADGRFDPATDRLVFAGKIGWGVNDLVEQIRVNPRTADTIVFAEGLSDAGIAALYRGAQVCLMPSYDEGYGLPLAEALALGKVCLSSNAGALPEVGGDLVEYLDPLDVFGWRDALVRWLTAGPAAIAAREAVVRERHRPVTWDDSAARFAALVAEDVR